MRKSRSGPSTATIFAVVALTFSLVGTAVAANDGFYPKLTKSKVKQISKKQADKELKNNVNGSHVNLADKATDADNLGGVPASGYQKTGLTQFTPISTFSNSWTRFSNSFSQPGFWVDADGVVNLQGGLSGGTAPAAFALPANVRPQTFRSYVIRCSGGAGTGVVEINPASGNVAIFNQGGSNCSTFSFLDGLTFRPDN